VTEEKTTFCRICEAYCGLRVTVRDGRVCDIRPDPDHVVSRGYVCRKGTSFDQVTHDPDRVLHPQKKVDGAWQRISWTQAIDEIAAKLNAVRARYGPHAVALYMGNPAGYSYAHLLAARGFADAIGTRNTYGAGSQDNLAIFLSAKLLYGAHFQLTIPDLDRARYLLVVGANPAVSHGTLVNAPNVREKLRDIRRRGGKVVVLDPRRSETALLADEHHFVRPGSDAFVLLAMLNVVFAERLEATDFLARQARGAAWLRDTVASFTPELAAAQSGLAADTVRRLARELAGAEAACAYGRPVCGTFGTLAAWALGALNVVTGKLDVPGGAVFSDGLIDTVELAVRMGADERGRKRSRVGDHPDVVGELPSGILPDEITTPGEGQVRALVVTAGNPVLSTPNGAALAAALRSLECTVVLDMYESETAALADYLLPCTTFLEREDVPLLHSNLMLTPYAQWTDAVVPPQGEAKPEWEVFALLSDAMGVPMLDSRLFAWARRAARLFGADLGPRALLDLLVRLGPAGDRFVPWSRGLSLAKLAAQPHGVLLPPLRTGVLRDKLRTRDRRVHLDDDEIAAEIHRLRAVAAAPAADGGYPFRLIGRRDPRSNNSWLHNVPRLMEGERCTRLRVHPEDAARLGLADGDSARVRSRVGALEVAVRVTDEVMPGVVSLPHGWGHRYPTNRRVAAAAPGASYNTLVDHTAIEALAGMSLLNGFPVAIERVAGQPAAASSTAAMTASAAK
jgi:formate dehydrogenase